MLKPVVPKFCPDLCSRLKDIAEKQVPTKLEQIVHSCERAPYSQEDAKKSIGQPANPRARVPRRMSIVLEATKRGNKLSKSPRVAQEGARELRAEKTAAIAKKEHTSQESAGLLRGHQTACRAMSGQH